MKIGEKKEWKSKHTSVKMERIKPDWKVVFAWIIFIGAVVWLVWFR